MLHISFRAQTNDEIIDTTYAFELDEDTDRLSVDQAHWLRDMRSLPPSPATAQRLVLAGLVVKGTSSQPDPALDAALDKLEALSGDLVVFIPEPPFLEVVRDCVEEETPLRFTLREVRNRGERPRHRALQGVSPARLVVRVGQGAGEARPSSTSGSIACWMPR